MRSSRLLLTLALFGPACTLVRTDVSECSRSSDCRRAFGIAALCGADGFCQVMDEEPRCSVAYPTDFETSPGDYPNIALIGTIIDGDNPVHRARARAVQVAIQDANEQGAVGEATFGLITCNNGDTLDDSLSPEEASVRAATWLRDAAEVAFIVGPPSSSATQAVFEQVSDVLLISPSASSDVLTGLDETAPTDERPGRLWRTAVPDGQQAPVITADMRARGIRSVAIIHAPGPYGVSLAELVRSDLDGSGVSVEVYPFQTAATLGATINMVGGTSAEEVLFISSDATQTASFLNTATTGSGASDYATKSFFLTDAAANATFVGAVTQVSVFERVRGTRPVQTDSAQLDTFQTLYQLRFGEDIAGLSFTPNAYDAAWIGLYGYVWALRNEPDTSWISIARGLRKLSAGFEVSTTTPSSLGTVQSEFANGASVDAVGASGNLDFDLATEELSGNFEVWTVVGRTIISAR